MLQSFHAGINAKTITTKENRKSATSLPYDVQNSTQFQPKQNEDQKNIFEGALQEDVKDFEKRQQPKTTAAPTTAGSQKKTTTGSSGNNTTGSGSNSTTGGGSTGKLTFFPFLCFGKKL